MRVRISENNLIRLAGRQGLTSMIYSLALELHRQLASGVSSTLDDRGAGEHTAASTLSDR